MKVILQILLTVILLPSVIIVAIWLAMFTFMLFTE